MIHVSLLFTNSSPTILDHYFSTMLAILTNLINLFLTFLGALTAGTNHSMQEAFQQAGITAVSLDASSSEGQFTCGNDVLKSLGKPGTFLQLIELLFNGTHIKDFNLVYLHHLPKLSVLNLDNTGIGNEATLIGDESNITSESVPALMLLANLASLSILGTGVDMDGLRFIAKTILEEGRNLDIEIPCACKDYMDNLGSMYLIHIQPPLVASPDDCSSLSIATVKENLAAHSKQNPRIMASGTRDEMIARLQDLLTKRQMDLVVAWVVGL
ncbi:hypothetical protein DFP72DRAFT_892635 [Ephemerocybe angulata]|uniref:Uncharacterized protein n=1 Tax=Ephemerocybe angulata TaxID=980116 RepID=A0A8H6I2U9_9AGAR|nr:hypothetical protein DFP72DRAFT_892635 [Tulosesus angulatus]